MAARATKKTRKDNFPERGTVDLMTIESDVLQGNALGDPDVRHVPVYLPPGYASGTERYPALVALTGFTGSGRMMLNVAAWSESFNERMDRLIAADRIGPMIVAMPDCFTRLGGSQYLNSTATGRYEDHLIEEVVPQLDAQYRTLAAPAHRGVFGKSSTSGLPRSADAGSGARPGGVHSAPSSGARATNTRLSDRDQSIWSPYAPPGSCVT
jgi:enterochelin esterase-like enzyme